VQDTTPACPPEGRTREETQDTTYLHPHNSLPRGQRTVKGPRLSSSAHPPFICPSAVGDSTVRQGLATSRGASHKSPFGHPALHTSSITTENNGFLSSTRSSPPLHQQAPDLPIHHLHNVPRLLHGGTSAPQQNQLEIEQLLGFILLLPQKRRRLAAQRLHALRQTYRPVPVRRQGVWRRVEGHH